MPIMDVGGPPSPNFLVTPSTAAVVQTVGKINTVEHIQVTLTNAVITIVDATGEYAGVALFTLPDKNLLILNAEVNITAVKGNATNGLNATDDINMGVGTAVATNLTLSTTMQNIIPTTAITADTVSVTFQASMFSAVGTGAAFLSIPDASNNVVYLNMSSSGGVMSADDTLTCSGTLDLWVLDLGNITS